MDRGNHYECAFDAFIRARGLLVLGVDESRRGTLGDASIKSLDFLVIGSRGVRLVVDVKGRRFPAGPESKRRYTWECWASTDDVDGLGRWATLLGEGYVGLLVFVYHVLPEVILPEDAPDCWDYQGRSYLLRAVNVDDYRRYQRVRSPRWGTVALARRDYARVVRPLSAFLGEPEADLVQARQSESWLTS
jgi:hypothetical protein